VLLFTAQAFVVSSDSIELRCPPASAQKAYTSPYNYHPSNFKSTLHKQQKCFIGKAEAGFDLLGYQVFPNQQLRPSAESIRRLAKRYRWLYEQGVSVNRLRQYVDRWCCRLWGGLGSRVTHQGGGQKYWQWLQIQTRVAHTIK
jgi:hypothetical protein